MENQHTKSETRETKITKHVEILGSEGKIYERDGKTFWYMNGTEKEPHEAEPVWPIISSEIERVKQEGKLNDIDHIRISPAVALHLIFEGHISPEGFQNNTELETEMTIDPSRLHLPNDTKISFVIERNMLQNRSGSDVLIIDKSNVQL